MPPVDLGFLLLAVAAIAVAIALSVVAGTLAARLFLRATRGD
jgi:hypothetical protein